MSISNANAIVLLNAGFICKEDAMVYWRWREHAGCHHLFLAPNNRTKKALKNQDTPCVSICRFNDDDVCIGCGRTVKEVHDAYLESIEYYEGDNI